MNAAPAGRLAEILKSLLCDVFAFYYRAHSAHWNVVGQDFSQYHALFDMIVGDVYESIDPLAENVRKLDAFTPSSLRDIAAGSSIGSGPVKFDPASLAADLLAANENIITKWKLVFTAADAVNEQGIANFAAERIDMHQKWRWQLKSSVSVTMDLTSLQMDLDGDGDTVVDLDNDGM